MPFGRLILCSWCPFVRLLVPLCEAKTLFAGGFCKAVNCSRWPLMPVLVSKAVTTYLLAVNLCSARICPDRLKGHSNRNELLNVVNVRTTPRCIATDTICHG